MMERIKGLIDAPFTPFYENGEVNLEPIEAYAKMLVKNGLQGVFIMKKASSYSSAFFKDVRFPKTGAFFSISVSRSGFDSYTVSSSMLCPMTPSICASGT